MYRKMLLCPLTVVVMLIFALPTVRATPFTVTVDVSSISGSDFELLVELFDNDFIIGNSSVLIDNVFIRDAGGLITPPEPPNEGEVLYLSPNNPRQNRCSRSPTASSP